MARLYNDDVLDDEMMSDARGVEICEAKGEGGTVVCWALLYILFTFPPRKHPLLSLHRNFNLQQENRKLFQLSLHSFINMYSAIIASAFAAAALAAPTKRQASPGGPSDGVILNYALTLEHLENAFYKEVLERFTLADFQAVGLDNVFYNNLQQISSDEATHVEFLTTALTAAGVTPVVPNGYAFGITDVNSALALSNALEGVGVSAYLGAAQFISSGDYLTVSILPFSFTIPR
jgi:AICAR transformylase/IMP cyclohydrolase PurH